MRGRLPALLAVLALAGAAVLDGVRPAAPRVPEASTVRTRAGVLACPIATLGRGSAYLHLANVAGTEASVRVTLFPTRGKAVVISESLGPFVGRTIALHTRVRGAASALVEHSGGAVVASHSLWASPERGLASGAAAGACAPSSTTVVAIAPTRTLGTETSLMLFNPGAADAVVSIELLMADRRAAPERLTQRIVPAHGRREFQLGSFAFDEREVIVLVEASSGRVVPEALVSSTARGIELVGAQPPSDELVLTYAQGRAGSTRSLATAGDDDTAATARPLGEDGFTADATDLVLTPTMLARAPGPPGQDAAAVVIRRSGGSQLVGGASWLARRAAGTDIASLEGLAPFTRWAAAMGSLADRSATAALIVNPGTEPVTAQVVTRGPAGETRTSPTIPPGAVHRLGVAEGRGTFSIVVDADGPVTVSIVQAALAFRQRSAQYLDLPALPLRPPLPVAAVADARAGIPART